MSCKVLIWTIWTKSGQFLEHVLWDGLCDPRRDCARLGGAKLWMPPQSHASNWSQPALASVCATWPVCVQLLKEGFYTVPNWGNVSCRRVSRWKFWRFQWSAAKWGWVREVAGREGVVVEGATNNTTGCMPEDLAEQEGVPRGWDLE